MRDGSDCASSVTIPSKHRVSSIEKYTANEQPGCRNLADRVRLSMPQRAQPPYGLADGSKHRASGLPCGKRADRPRGRDQLSAGAQSPCPDKTGVSGCSGCLIG